MNQQTSAPRTADARPDRFQLWTDSRVFWLIVSAIFVSAVLLRTGIVGSWSGGSLAAGIVADATLLVLLILSSRSYHSASSIVRAVTDRTDREVRKKDRAEKALKKSIESLNQSEAKLRGLFDQSLNFIGLLTVDGILVDANRTALAAAGVEGSEVLNKPFVDSVWWSHSPQLQQRLLQAIKVAGSGTTDRFEATHIGTDGATIHVDFSLKPIRNQDGEIIFLVPEGRDVTLQKKHEERLNEILRNLAQSNRELEQFAYVASHDLQEPLRKITSYGELLRDKCEGVIDEAGLDYLNVITGSVSRLKKLVRDLLSFSRITTEGKEPEPVDTDACLATAIDDLEVAINETKAQVSCDPLPSVLADDSQLTMLFRNLVSNALKYRSEDRTPIIHVGSETHGERVEFFVKDNGIGIEEKFFGRIFEIFKRLHNRQKHSGTGIGLALCKRIVDRMNGSMRVESTPGEGSTFFFTATPADQLVDSVPQFPQTVSLPSNNSPLSTTHG